jgi:hypothetical protein
VIALVAVCVFGECVVVVALALAFIWLIDGP